MTRPNERAAAPNEIVGAPHEIMGAPHEMERAPHVIEIDVRGLSRDEGHDMAFGALAAALAGGGRFAAVVLVPDEPAANEGRGGRRLAHLRWLKANRPALAKRCAGIAFVMSAELTRGSAKLLAAGSKVMGCPVSAHRTADAAHEWARQR